MSSFCICKSYSHFFSKNTSELDIVLTRAVNILTTVSFRICVMSTKTYKNEHNFSERPIAAVYLNGYLFTNYDDNYFIRY